MSYRVVTATLAITFAMLGGCGSDSKTETPVVAAPKKVVSPVKTIAATDPTAKMAHAVTVGKPVAPVDLKYDILAKPEPGTPTEVQIALIPSASVDDLSVTVSAPAGITLAGTLTTSFKQPEVGEPCNHSFSMLPDKTGMFFLTVAATTTNAGVSDTRTFSVPFMVGDTPAAERKPAALMQKDSTGEKVQSMQAEEKK